MRGHSSARAERVRSEILWGKAKYGHSYSQALGSDDGNDVGCADGAEVMVGGIISDGVVGSHPWSRRRRKMLIPALNSQAAADSERKWETVSPHMAFFLLSRVMTV